MSTSLLYHALGVVGYRCVHTKFGGGRIVMCIEQPRERLRCSACQCDELWALLAPLVWILCDGMGPGSIETTGWHSAAKFVAGWGGPFVVIGVALAIVIYLERRQRSG